MSKDELLENADQALRIAKPDQSSSGDGPPASRSAVDRDPKRELERIFGDGSSGDWWRL